MSSPGRSVDARRGGAEVDLLHLRIGLHLGDGALGDAPCRARSTVTEVANARMKSMSCSTTTTVRSPPMRRNRSPVSSRSSWLIPATGSSSSSTSAFCTSSMPISSHCFCPCASTPAGLSASVGQTDGVQGLLDRRAARRTGAAAASTHDRPAPAAMSRFCSTVSCSNTLAVWNVRPTPSRAIW